MPDIPDVPGVPSLSSYAANAIELLVADTVDYFVSLFAPQWGIYLDGVPVLSYDNQATFGYTQEWRISTYPVENGSFASYDKVQQPAEIRCRFSAGADAVNRQAMIQSVQSVMNTVNLYDVVTPEAVFTGFNFIRWEYDREAANVGLVVVDIILMEVIETATAQFSNTQNPTMGGTTGLGTVQAQAPDQQTQSSFSASDLD